MVRPIEWASAVAVVIASACLLLVYGYALGFAKAKTEPRAKCPMTYEIPFKGTFGE